MRVIERRDNHPLPPTRLAHPDWSGTARSQGAILGLEVQTHPEEPFSVFELPFRCSDIACI